MPRKPRGKGIRLWLQPERRDRETGRILEHAVWVIRDGPRKRSTGCGPNDRAQAEGKLAHYIAERHRPEAQDSADPRKVLIADVLNLYLRDIAPAHARPEETSSRIDRLLDWWSDPETARADLRKLRVDDAFAGVVADIRGATCRCFAASMKSQSSARRHLEDLRSAVNHAADEGLIDRAVPVTMPPKPVARERWLTRSEAARALRAAWRYRETLEGRANGRASRKVRRHVARFILVGLYTGTRKAAILGAAFERIPGCGFIDLDNGVYYRQPEGKRQTKKRQPPVRIPRRLLAHMRRWRRTGQTFLIEYNGQPVAEIQKAFAAVMDDAGLAGVTPHTLRHTAATWAMQNGGDTWQIAGYLGMSYQTLIDNYGHHHPNHYDGAGEIIANGPPRPHITPTAPRQVQRNKEGF